MTVLPSAEKLDAPDRDAIVRVVQLYVDGFNDCDVDKFIQAFHEDAWIFFTHRDGTLYKGLIADSFEEWATPPAQRIVGRVISVTQAGDIASVLLGFDNADDLFDGSGGSTHAASHRRDLEDHEQDSNALQQSGLGRSQSARRTGRAGLSRIQPRVQLTRPSRACACVRATRVLGWSFSDRCS